MCNQEWSYRSQERNLRQADTTRGSNNMMHNTGHENIHHNFSVPITMIFPMTRIRNITETTVTKTLTLILTITFPRTKPLTRTLTFARIGINSNV